MSAGVRALVSTRTTGAPSARLKDWLLTSALPLWSQAGLDPDGGFFERIDAGAGAVRGPRRARVLGRQIYAYARAPTLGWTGPAAGVVRHGLARLSAFVRPDGLVQSRLDDTGRPLEAPIDLYDQAFILFGTAHAVDVVGGDALPAFAATLREALARFAHPLGGYEEALPRTLPLRANPHMHLLEAGLAWEARSDGSERANWAAFCDGVATLALERMIDPETGALHEHFDGDWRRATAPDLAVVEPGHQFEWAWLLTRWGEARGDNRALTAADRLREIGEGHGVDASGLTIAELGPDLAVQAGHARLWAQGERAKAWAQRALRVEGAARTDALDRMEAACAALMRFVTEAPMGGWRDRITADGVAVEESAPASSLYHIVGAAEETAGATGSAPMP